MQDASVPLIGSLGTSFVSQQLSENAPGVAIQAIQGKAGLQNPACAPLLGMVDQLKIPRFEAHRGMLLAARHMLLAKVQHQMEDRVKLERLLNVSFKYLGIQELREVPLAVMEKLDKVGGSIMCCNFTCCFVSAVPSLVRPVVCGLPRYSCGHSLHTPSAGPTQPSLLLCRSQQLDRAPELLCCPVALCCFYLTSYPCAPLSSGATCVPKAAGHGQEHFPRLACQGPTPGGRGCN